MVWMWTFFKSETEGANCTERTVQTNEVVLQVTGHKPHPLRLQMIEWMTLERCDGQPSSGYATVRNQGTYIYCMHPYDAHREKKA